MPQGLKRANLRPLRPAQSPRLLAAGELKETAYRVVTKSGDIRDVLLSATVERGAAGNVASVVGGLVDVPVIAVPTSVGYGASFEGIGPLLTMLNACAAGVAVVNIDNGFWAGYLAATIARRPGRN